MDSQIHTLFRKLKVIQFSSVTQLCPTLRPHESQHARPPCPSPTPGVHSNSGPLSPWCHRAISSSVVPFSSCPQSLPALGSFPMSQLFTSGGQSTGVSALASFLPKNTQDWSPLFWYLNCPEFGQWEPLRELPVSFWHILSCFLSWSIFFLYLFGHAAEHVRS